MQRPLTRCLFHKLLSRCTHPNLGLRWLLALYASLRIRKNGFEWGTGDNLHASYRFLKILTEGVNSSRTTLECQRTKLFVEIIPGRCQRHNSHPVGTFCAHPRTCIQTTKGVHLIIGAACELGTPWVICAPAFKHKLDKFCIYRGFSESVFLRKPHKRTEEIRIGQWKGYCMEHCGSETPWHAKKFKMADRRMKFQETQ